MAVHRLSSHWRPIRGAKSQRRVERRAFGLRAWSPRWDQALVVGCVGVFGGRLETGVFAGVSVGALRSSGVLMGGRKLPRQVDTSEVDIPASMASR